MFNNQHNTDLIFFQLQLPQSPQFTHNAPCKCTNTDFLIRNSNSDTKLQTRKRNHSETADEHNETIELETVINVNVNVIFDMNEKGSVIWEMPALPTLVI